MIFTRQTIHHEDENHEQYQYAEHIEEQSYQGEIAQRHQALRYSSRQFIRIPGARHPSPRPLPQGALHNKSILDSFFGSFAIYNYQ
jgi:hypothetical protein